MLWAKVECLSDGGPDVGEVEVRLSARELGLLLSRRDGGTLNAEPRRGLGGVMGSSGATVFGEVFSFLRS